MCTLGPAQASVNDVVVLARAGMDCARINFSHGDLGEHARTIRFVRSAESRLHSHLPVMQDLPGPKIRVGILRDGSVLLKRGERVILDTANDTQVASNEIPIKYRGLENYVLPGTKIYLSDGSIKLDVISAERGKIHCRCVVGGKLQSEKGVNIPTLSADFKTFTEADDRFLAFGIENRVDLVAVSFVRSAQDIVDVRKRARELGGDPMIVAKIEKKDAVDNISEISSVSDIVMVARGDLGAENPVEQVPVMQKKIIALCRARGIPVITATQMLESMVNNPTPTRAEVTDIANAILDGTDALMLSEETAVGSYPAECVGVLHRVSLLTEANMKRDTIPDDQGATDNLVDALGRGSDLLAKDMGAKLLVSLNDSTSVVSKIARFRPKAPIVCITSTVEQARKLRMVWGVFPKILRLADPMHRLGSAVATLSKEWSLKKGERMIIISSDVSLSNHEGELIFIVQAGQRSDKDYAKPG
ncbi:MAG: pyruvate kinase [Nitrososphaerota archaeon]|nr:pyruvate kinase [Nitrososphaerota archaeon]